MAAADVPLPLTIGGKPVPNRASYSPATALAGSKQRGNAHQRRKCDLYETPDCATAAFWAAEAAAVFAHAGPIWEPACGRGAISRLVAGLSGREVISTDANNHGFGTPGVDFLSTVAPLARVIITNPPYDTRGGEPLPVLFAEHAWMRLKVDYLAMCLKQSFWNAGNRRAVWRRMRPARIYQTTFRVDFTGQGAAPMGAIWCVWDRSAPADQCVFHLLDESGVVG